MYAKACARVNDILVSEGIVSYMFLWGRGRHLTSRVSFGAPTVPAAPFLSLTCILLMMAHSLVFPDLRQLSTSILNVPLQT